MLLKVSYSVAGVLANNQRELAASSRSKGEEFVNFNMEHTSNEGY